MTCLNTLLSVHEPRAGLFISCAASLHRKNGNKLSKQINLIWWSKQKKKKRLLRTPLNICDFTVSRQMGGGGGGVGCKIKECLAPSHVHTAGKHERNSSKLWPPWHVFFFFFQLLKLIILSYPWCGAISASGWKGGWGGVWVWVCECALFFHPLFRKVDIFRSRHIKE